MSKTAQHIVFAVLLVALLAVAVALAGCASTGTSVTFGGYQEFYEDPDTHVQYIIAYGASGDNGMRSVAITPRLSADGSVMVDAG